ncbi:hypothetical protein [Salininema proteolyticum]|uniref:DNA primase n=1 Tax=Salininema proteolyticum TaxID=1607685 RepID=A0ABV8TTZ1_9ACTN
MKHTIARSAASALLAGGLVFGLAACDGDDSEMDDDKNMSDEMEDQGETDGDMSGDDDMSGEDESDDGMSGEDDMSEDGEMDDGMSDGEDSEG